MQELDITHVMNSLYQERFTIEYRKINETGRGYWEAGRDNKSNVLYGLGLLRTICRISNPIQGGTIGFCGSHDYQSLYDAALEDAARTLVEKENDYRRIPNFADLELCSSLVAAAAATAASTTGSAG